MRGLWQHTFALILLAAIPFLFSRGAANAQNDLLFPALMSQERIEALTEAWNKRLEYVPGEVLVKFKPGVEIGAPARVLTVVRGGIRQTDTRWIGDVLWVRAGQEHNAEALADVLQRQPEVEYAQPNYIRRLESVPNDPSYSRQWNFDLIDLPRAWDINKGANNTVTVAVIDSGINTVTRTITFRLWTGLFFENVPIPYAQNPDLHPARISTGRDFVITGIPLLDMDGHGTHVAGTVLQETNNSFGLAGVAYQAKLLPLKACMSYWDLQLIRSAAGLPGFIDPRVGTSCEDADTTAALRFAADSGAQVINLSIGGAAPAPALLDALRYAVQKGSFVSISAGNGFEDGNPREYPASYAAQINGVVAVGAVGRSSRRAYYSTTGDYVELVAPGGDFRDGGSSGGVYQAGLFPPDYNAATIIRPRFDRYIELAEQGTSMAAPHVAGVAALLYSQGIRSAAAIEATLKASAKDLGAPGRDNDYGVGLIDARSALRGLGVSR